jgi:uncharacterized membrane protein YeaQ/YmgE (transglycosylase-associated protein family)
MIGMHFAGFLTLLIISLITGLIVHFAARYRFLAGADRFIAKWIFGWIAAWVASPVLGYWFSGVNIGTIYIIPAFIGGFAGAFLPAAICKAMAVAWRPRVVDVHETTRAA